MSNINWKISFSGASSSNKDLKRVFLRRYSSYENFYFSEHYEPPDLKNLVKGTTVTSEDLILIRDSSGEFQVTFRDKAREKCFKCKKRLNFTYGFCPRCDVKPWTSGNQLIDEFILKWQSRVEKHGWLEWIPYDEFTDIEFIARGGFGTVSKAIWKKGPRNLRLNGSAQWSNPNMMVALKKLDDAKDYVEDFLRETRLHIRNQFNLMFIRFYGITQDPETEEYLMVIEYADGNLRDYLKKNRDSFTWQDKAKTAYILASSLDAMHSVGIIHCDFHPGNVLVFEYIFSFRELPSKDKKKHLPRRLMEKMKKRWNCFRSRSYPSEDDGSERSEYHHFYPMISDFGLARPLNYNKDDKKLYGIIPYVAPEVLNGKEYTKASDVYSYGMILWELASCRPPFADRKYDLDLAIEIIGGLRPEFTEDTPNKYREIIGACWDPNPEKRPSMTEIRQQFGFRGAEGTNGIFIWPRFDPSFLLEDPCLDMAEFMRRLELFKTSELGKLFLGDMGNEITSEHNSGVYTYSQPLPFTKSDVSFGSKDNDLEINSIGSSKLV